MKPGTKDERRRESDRALYRRIVIAWQDLADARAAVNRLVGLNNEIPASDPVLRNALIASAVVSYGRCFARSRGTITVLRSLPDAFLKLLDEQQLALHSRILELRNKEFAHSDGDVANLEVAAMPDFRGGLLVPTSRRLRLFSVSDDDLRAMDGLLEKIHIYLYDEMLRLYPVLAPHGDF